MSAPHVSRPVTKSKDDGNETKPRSESPVKQPKQLSAVSDDEVTSIFKNLVIYTLLIVFLPIASYFGAKKLVFEQYFGATAGQSAIYWAIFAVASIHVVLGVMVYRAYREGVKPRNIKQD